MTSSREAVFGMFGGRDVIERDLLGKNVGGVNVPD